MTLTATIIKYKIKNNLSNYQLGKKIGVSGYTLGAILDGMSHIVPRDELTLTMELLQDFAREIR